jgi:Wzt C-terminal domain
VTAEQGAPVCVRMEVGFHAAASNPIFGISLANEGGHPVFAASTHIDEIATGEYAAGDTAVVRFYFENWLGPGRFRLHASIAREGLGADLFDLHSKSTLIVLAPHSGGGAVDLPHRIEIEPA